MPRKLTEKQEKFLTEYIGNGRNASKAYRAAYDAERMNDLEVGKESARLLRHPLIALRLQPLERKADLSLERALDRYEVTIDRVIRELSYIGFANIMDYMAVGADGAPRIDMSRMTREQSAALSEITVEEFMDGRGEDAREVRRVKFKLASKESALVNLGKHLGGFIERRNVDVTDTRDQDERRAMIKRELYAMVEETRRARALDAKPVLVNGGGALTGPNGHGTNGKGH